MPLISLSNILMISIIQTLLIGFHLYTPKDLEIKETTETASCVSFLDIYLNFYTNDQHSTRLYDNRNEVNCVTINCPHLDRNIPTTSGSLYDTFELAICTSPSSEYKTVLSRGFLKILLSRV